MSRINSGEMKEKVIIAGDVWLVDFPLEEDSNQFLSRPVIVLDVETLEVLSVKITKTDPRNEDVFDTPIFHWENAKLHFKSTARVSKTIKIPKVLFKHMIGRLHSDDFKNVQQLFMKFISLNESNEKS